MSKTCVGCHFLATELPQNATGTAFTFTLSEEDRRATQERGFPDLQEMYILKCHMGVWDQGLGLAREELAKRILQGGRESACFFFPFRKGMMMPAAVELQQREAQNRELKRSHLYTRIGLWIAALALAVSAVLQFVGLVLQ